MAMSILLSRVQILIFHGTGSYKEGKVECELLQIGITFSGFSANLHEESSQQICGNRGYSRLYSDTKQNDDMMGHSAL